MPDDLERALEVLGPLEARIMRAAWAGWVSEPFTVRDVLALLPELAYTTVLTTMRRLADKGVLVTDATVGRKAYEYRVAGGPGDFLATESTRDAAAAVQRYGEAALAAFAARLDDLDPEQRARLERLRER